MSEPEVPTTSSGCSGATPCPDRTGQDAGSVCSPGDPTSLQASSLDPHEISCGAWPLRSQTETDHAKTGRRDLPRPAIPQPAQPLPNPIGCSVALRHRSWWHDRLRVHRALDAIYPDTNRSVRFGQCGSRAFVSISDTDPPEYGIEADYCRDRWCRPCQRERGRIIAANIVDHLDGARCRLVTLTIRTHGLSLADAVIKLYTSFSKLRLTAFWRTRVTGGCAVCEIKPTQDGLRWHPHLHLLVQGSYIPQAWLAKKWYAITGDSYIVDVRSCTHSEDAARYVTKYLSKPVPSAIVRNESSLTEAIRALAGRRMVATFGDWRGLKLTHTETKEGWHTLCSFADLATRVLQRDREACRIMSHLAGQASLDPSDLDNWIRETLTLKKHTQTTLDFPTSIDNPIGDHHPPAPDTPIVYPQGHVRQVGRTEGTSATADEPGHVRQGGRTDGTSARADEPNGHRQPPPLASMLGAAAHAHRWAIHGPVSVGFPRRVGSGQAGPPPERSLAWVRRRCGAFVRQRAAGPPAPSFGSCGVRPKLKLF